MDLLWRNEYQQDSWGRAMRYKRQFGGNSSSDSLNENEYDQPPMLCILDSRLGLPFGTNQGSHPLSPQITMSIVFFVFSTLPSTSKHNGYCTSSLFPHR
jgi:hypothetical protein